MESNKTSGQMNPTLVCSALKISEWIKRHEDVGSDLQSDCSAFGAGNQCKNSAPIDCPQIKVESGGICAKQRQSQRGVSRVALATTEI